MEAKAKEFIFAIVILFLGTCHSQASYRLDYRCGGSYQAPNGDIAKCNPSGLFPCCSPGHWCGNTADHCDCDGCVNYKTTGSEYRADFRCGGDYLAPNGEVAKCDPNGSFPCCSPQNWCGNTAAHCDCSGCVDFRTESD